MITIPNFLSLLRAPLAFAFLSDNAAWRLTAVVAAMITDSLDGYLARRQQSASQLGALLDPLTDKFFMVFALSVLLIEHRLSGPQMLELLSRDFAIFIFGCYLSATGAWSSYHLRAIWAGKITTTCQFFVLIALMCGVTPPAAIYHLFVVLGIAALIELYLFQSAPQRASS